MHCKNLISLLHWRTVLLLCNWICNFRYCHPSSFKNETSQYFSWRELNINITGYCPCVSHVPSNRMDCITIQYCTWHRLWSVMIKSVWLKPTPTNSFVVGTLQWRELVGAGYSQTAIEWKIWMFLEVIISKDCNTCTCTNMFSLVWTSCAKPTFRYHQVQLQGILFCEWNTVQTGITADK